MFGRVSLEETRARKAAGTRGVMRASVWVFILQTTAGFTIRCSGSIDRPLLKVLEGSARAERGGKQGTHSGYSKEGQ